MGSETTASNVSAVGAPARRYDLAFSASNFIDDKSPPIELFAFHSCNRGSTLYWISHQDDGKSAKSPGLFLRSKVYILDLPVRIEQLPNYVLSDQSP